MEKLLPLSLITTQGGIESLISLCSTLIEGQKKRAQSRFQEERGWLGWMPSQERSPTPGSMGLFLFFSDKTKALSEMDGQWWEVGIWNPSWALSSSEFRAGGRSDVELSPIGAPWSCGLMQVLRNKVRRPERLEFVARAWGTSFSYCKPSLQDKSLVRLSQRSQNLLNCGCSRSGHSTTRFNLEIILLSALEGAWDYLTPTFCRWEHWSSKKRRDHKESLWQNPAPHFGFLVS